MKARPGRCPGPAGAVGPWADEIHLNPRADFADAAAYYGTALHEVGHENRLARELGPFGSDIYAREELRAEISSYMLARELGIGHGPSRHAAYVESWLKVLKEDRNEIFRAARDAEEINTWVMEPEKRPELERNAQTRVAAAQAEEHGVTETPAVRVYLSVPFSERSAAKEAGAQWSKRDKSWWVPEGTDLAPFERWSTETAKATGADVSPVVEFGDALRAHGLLVDGAPAMDGKWHRVPVDGDRKGQFSGSYVGYLPKTENERAAGLITNWKAGVTADKWVAAGATLSAEQKAELQA